MQLKHFWIVVIAALIGAASLSLVRQRQQTDTAAARAQAVACDQQLQDEAFQAYRSGREDFAVPALSTYLRYLEQIRPLGSPWQKGQNPWLDARGLATERMLTAGRLASVIEEKEGPEQAAALWQRAVEYARASGWSDVSLPAVREAVEFSGPIVEPPELELEEAP